MSATRVVTLHFDVTPDDGMLTAQCREISAMITSGESMDRLQRVMVPDLIQGYFEACRERGIIGQVLAKAGCQVEPTADPLLVEFALLSADQKVPVSVAA